MEKSKESIRRGAERILNR
ncbi:hypothetical protein Q3C04_05325 [Rickettsia rickettsii]|nr:MULTISPECIES: hypothetical protein [spotted fever group]